MTFREQCAIEAMKVVLAASAEKTRSGRPTVALLVDEVWQIADAMEAERLEREPAKPAPDSGIEVGRFARAFAVEPATDDGRVYVPALGCYVIPALVGEDRCTASNDGDIGRRCILPISEAHTGLPHVQGDGYAWTE